MGVNLTAAHNDAALGLINWFIGLAKKGEVENNTNALASTLGLIAGRELLKNTMGDRLAKLEPGAIVIVEEINEGGRDLTGFLFWLGKSLNFKPPRDEAVALSHAELTRLLGLITAHQAEIEAVFDGYHLGKADRPYVAVLAVLKAVEMNGNDQAPFTFSDAASLAVAGMVHGAKTVS